MILLFLSYMHRKATYKNVNNNCLCVMVCHHHHYLHHHASNFFLKEHVLLSLTPTSHPELQILYSHLNLEICYSFIHSFTNSLTHSLIH